MGEGIENEFRIDCHDGYVIIQLVVAMVAAGEPQCKVTKRRAHGQGADEDDVCGCCLCMRA